MKKAILIPSMIALCCGAINESFAEIASGDNCNSTMYSGSVGVDCSWSITDDGLLIIKGSSSQAKTTQYAWNDMPWKSYSSEVKAILLDNVRADNYYQLGLSRSTYPNLQEIIYTNGGSAGTDALGANSLQYYQQHNCGGDITVNDCLLSLDIDYGCDNGYLRRGDYCVESSVGCGDDMQKKGHCVSDCGAGYLGKGNKCIPASQGCGVNYRLSDGICYRVRYTPAEAAQVAGESNTIFLYYK